MKNERLYVVVSEDWLGGMVRVDGVFLNRSHAIMVAREKNERSRRREYRVVSATKMWSE